MILNSPRLHRNRRCMVPNMATPLQTSCSRMPFLSVLWRSHPHSSRYLRPGMSVTRRSALHGDISFFLAWTRVPLGKLPPEEEASTKAAARHSDQYECSGPAVVTACPDLYEHSEPTAITASPGLYEYPGPATATASTDPYGHSGPAVATASMCLHPPATSTSTPGLPPSLPPPAPTSTLGPPPSLPPPTSTGTPGLPPSMRVPYSV